MMKWMLGLGLVTSVAAAAAEIHGESPRSMMLEVKFSPYTPFIDRPFGNTDGPYQTVFGGGPMLLGEIEFEYQFFQKLGSLSAGLSVGYAEKFGRAIDEVTREATSQTTGLQLVPFKGLLVYRFDWLSIKHDIPLVPYLKGAVAVMPWWVTKGDGVEVDDRGIRGAGLSTGLAGVAGLAITLDFLDQRLARDFDTGMGVNHTYIFGEFTLQEMGLFSPKAALDMSSQHWLFGLSFEF